MKVMCSRHEESVIKDSLCNYKFSVFGTGGGEMICGVSSSVLCSLAGAAVSPDGSVLFSQCS